MKATRERIDKDFRRARRLSAGWTKAAKEDLKIALGDQWDSDAKRILEEQGRPALNLNIIQPLLFLISGYQRDSRSTLRAYPEGQEDNIKADITTRLIKNMVKKSDANYKMSFVFEDGITLGKGFALPFFDYTYDLIHGAMKFKKGDPFSIRIDPGASEYDMSDANYVVIDSFPSEETLIEFFPEKEAVIKALARSQGTSDTDIDVDFKEDEDYKAADQMDPSAGDSDENEDNPHHLIEYHYKNFETKYLAVDTFVGEHQLFDTKKEARAYLNTLATVHPPEEQLNKDETQKIFKRKVPEFRIAWKVGDVILDDQVSPFFPQWRNFGVIPFLAHYNPTAKQALKREDLAYQGIVRNLKDPQREKNKRRSSTLHILNTTANAGWLCEENTWVDKEEVKEFGSKPGAILEYKTGKPKPERLTPANIPQGHIILEEQSEQDIKLISGVNADLLAMQDKNTSGKAIALRQQQGILMLRRIFDNFSMSLMILGRFMLSQMGQFYTVDKAKRVLGERFLMDNGQDIPVNNPLTGQPGVDPMTGQPQTKRVPLDDEVIAQCLQDTEQGDYDISIGEGLDSPTVRYATFMMLQEMSQSMPIPPEIMMQYADIPDDVQQKIKAYQAQAQQIQMMQAQAVAQRGKPDTPAG